MQQGNELAFSQLYDKYSGALYGVIIRICKEEHLAQEILQEGFLKIWNSAASYDSNKGKFYTWAYRICKNAALNAIRNNKKLIQTDDFSVYKEEVSQEQSDIDPQKLKGAIQQLEVHHQNAIELVYFQGLTHREAHEVMQVPLGTFKSYVQQALKQLRELYKVSVWILMAIGELWI